MSLHLQGLSVTPHGGSPLFPPLSLTVTRDAVTTIMGASGVGKSTLLDAIGGHLAASFRLSGHIILNGRDVTHLPPEARHIGVLFQDVPLFPHLSVGDNLAFALPATLKGRPHRRAAVDAALTRAGLQGFYSRDPATLSGGQRARAALMRALLAEPKALLLDEPFSRLDATLRADLRAFTFAHTRAQGIPVLMVTHDAADALAASGPVITL